MACVNCNDEEMPDLTPKQVAIQFALSMVRWVQAGTPLVSENIHGQRRAKCEPCPFRKGAWCKKCRCLIIVKSKMATEGCPATPPKWLPFG